MKTSVKIVAATCFALANYSATAAQDMAANCRIGIYHLRDGSDEGGECGCRCVDPVGARPDEPRDHDDSTGAQDDSHDLAGRKVGAALDSDLGDARERLAVFIGGVG